MGRGILFKARWATAAEAPARPPRPKRRFRSRSTFRSSCSGRSASGRSIRCSTGSTFRACSAGIVHPEATFYPLDCVSHWNRMYGRRGFTQHQCVLPNEAGAAAARRFLEVLTARGGASFLCVIKDCGPEGVGMLSFPRPGISIALDIAVRKDTPALIDALNECVHDGRRADLPGEGRVHARRALSGDGAAHRRVPARARASGIPSGSCAARSRCACSGTTP